MLMEYVVIRKEDKTTVNVAGFHITFKRNEAGHMVADVGDGESLAFMRDSSSFREYHPEVDYPAPDEKTTEESFINEWLRLGKDRYIEYVGHNIERFNMAGDKTLEMAIKKWDRAVDGDDPRGIWPGRYPDNTGAEG